MLGIGAVAVHARGQYAHARKLKRLGDKVYIVHVQCNFRVATAGGLLIAVAEKDADALMSDLRGAVPSAQRIGTVGEYTGGARIKLAH